MPPRPSRQERRLAAREAAKELLAPEKDSPQSARDVLQAQAPEILRNLPARGQQILGELQVVTQTTITRSGPLPPAEELLAYENVVQGSGERILMMAEKQAAHRMEMERLVITRQQDQSARGQHYGLIIGLSGIIGGCVIAYLGHDWVGGTLIGTTVTGLVSTFVMGKYQQNKDLAEKKQAQKQLRQ